MFKNWRNWSTYAKILAGCVLLNIFFFLTGGGILSLVFGACCALGFYQETR